MKKPIHLSIGDGVTGLFIGSSFVVDDNANIALTFLGGIGISGIVLGRFGSFSVSATLWTHADQIYDLEGRVLHWTFIP